MALPFRIVVAWLAVCSLAAGDEPLPDFAVARVGTAHYRLPSDGMLAPAPDGRRVLALHGDTLWVMDLAEGTSRAIKGNGWSDPHCGLVLTADGKAVFCDQSGVLRVVDPSNGKTVHTCNQLGTNVSERARLVLSPDGRRVVAACGVRRGKEQLGQVLIFEPATGKVIADHQIDGFDVHGAALSADGKRFAVLGVGIDPPAVNGKQPERTDLIEVRDVESRKTITRMRGKVEGYSLPACFSPDGKLLATAMESGIEVWDAATGESRWKDANARQAREMRFTQDGAQLVALMPFSEVRVWDGTTGKAGRTYAAPKRDATPGAAAGRRDDYPDGTRMVFAADGRWLAVAWRGLALSAWDVKAEKPLFPVEGFTWPVTTLRFTSDSKQVIAATDALAIARADARTGQIVESISLKVPEELQPDPIRSTGQSGTAISSDGQHIAYATRSSQIVVADLTTGKQVWTAPLRNRSRFSYDVSPVFSPDGSKLAVGGNFGPGYSAPAEYPAIGVYDAASGKPIPQVEPRSGQEVAVAFSPNGKRLAVFVEQGLSTGDRLSGWDLAAGKPLATAKGGFGRWLAVAPDNRTAITTEENRIVGRDLLTGRVTRSLEFMPPEKNEPFSEGRPFGGAPDQYRRDRVGPQLTCPFTFSPDGRLFAVGADLGANQPVIHVYEWAGFGERFVLKGHAGPIRSLAFSPDGKTLASGSEDTSVLLWDLARLWKPSRTDSTAEALWASLSRRDAGPGWDAVRELAAQPEVAVTLLKERIKPAPPAPTDADIANLIKQLDALVFAEREKAKRELHGLGERAVPFLQRAAEKGPSAEVRQRAVELLKESDQPHPDFPMWSRAVEVLERIGTPAAQKLLESLAGGAAGHPLTVQARAALKRH